jgi:lysozyme family protein
MRYAVKWPEYAKQWDRMVIKPARVAEFTKLAAFAIAHKTIYQDIEDETHVPWWLIAVLHRRESDADFNTYLGNGQLLKRKTTIVPKGRGPFPTFQAGAEDALHLDGLDAIADWTLEKALYWCEAFNGWGYAPKPSPYIWGGTNVQVRGKYIRDGVFSSAVWDPQPGCAPILCMIAKLCPSVKFTRES